jgi:hypothetical protein
MEACKALGKKSEAQRKNKRAISDFHQKDQRTPKASVFFGGDETPKTRTESAVMQSLMQHAAIMQRPDR